MTTMLNAAYDPVVVRGHYGDQTWTRAVSTSATTAGVLVKGSEGSLHAIIMSNTTVTASYLKVYDKATAPAVGTDTPVLTVLIPPNTAVAQVALMLPIGMPFTNGIAYGFTSAAADSDSTAVTTGAVTGGLLTS